MPFTTINPATEEVLAIYSYMSKEEVLNILKSSHQSQQQWKKLTLQQRSPFFLTLAKVLRDNSKEYATLIAKEMGKPISNGLVEIEKCADLAESLVKNAPEWLKEETIGGEGKEHLIIFEPLGVVFIIMPWNFPFWQALKVGLPPLMAGNGIILKHARNVTGCSLAIEDAVKKAGFPQNLFRSIIVDHSLTEDIIASPHIHACSLTGSESVGQMMGELAGKHLKKVVLELGGSDPFIVLEDADIALAAEKGVKARFSNAGQICTSSKRFIVLKAIADTFTKKFVEETKKLIIGDPLDEKTQIGPLVNKKAVEEMEVFVKDALSKGAKILCGGKRVSGKGAFFEPTILGNVTPQMASMCQETFGPIAPIMIVKDEQEAISIANDHHYGLSASVWTKDLQRGKAVARKLDVGGVFINAMATSHPLRPLGGIKKSGFGRELSHYGIKEFVNVKSINVY